MVYKVLNYKMWTSTKATKHIPFHLQGYHWCRSHTKKWANLILGPDNLSVYPILHLRTKEKWHAHFKDKKYKWAALPSLDTQRFNVGLHLFILTVPSSLDFKNGSFASPALGKVATVVWSKEGADGYGRQETWRWCPATQALRYHVSVLGTLWPNSFFNVCTSVSKQVFSPSLMTKTEVHWGLCFSLNKGEININY